MAASGKARLTILRIFDHVRPQFPEPSASNILRVYVPEGTKLIRLVTDLFFHRR